MMFIETVFQTRQDSSLEHLDEVEVMVRFTTWRIQVNRLAIETMLIPIMNGIQLMQNLGPLLLPPLSTWPLVVSSPQKLETLHFTSQTEYTLRSLVS